MVFMISANGIPSGDTRMNMELRMAGLAQARPFQESLPWKQVITNQTRPFRPNRIYADYEAGVVVLVAMKSRSGDDFAVSADALTFFASA